MKKILALALALVAALTAVSAAFAYDWFDDAYPLYTVDTPDGGCCLCDRPSDTGRDLGFRENGDQVRVIWDNGSGWLYVVCTDGREGYLRQEDLTPVRSRSSGLAAVVRDGECPVLDQPLEGAAQLASLSPGDTVSIADWNADPDFARITLPRGGSGYVLKSCLQPLD